jgi:hypothetical protein
MKLTVIIFLTCSILGFADMAGVEKLQWIDPYGRQPITYTEWSTKHIDRTTPSHIALVYKKSTQRQQSVVNVVVNTALYYEIATEIDTFIHDLLNAGYAVQLDTISGMSHTSLRSHLAGITDLVGAIFVGEVPVAWFETSGFGSWEEFPHDLYFCDLNGTYTDSDGDGLYENHSGNVAPEIWVGRIYARNLTWDSEIRLIKNYFNKNHLYRTSGSPLPQKALSFVDDDWSQWTTCGLDAVYDTVTIVNNDYQTTALNYRTELGQGYEWIHICAHSSPWGHTFKYPVDQYRGTVFNYEIFSLAPQALFYNLFACSGTRFTEENTSAGWYLFGDDFGLCIIGSAKTGGMLSFSDFYDPLGAGACIGDAFKTWFTLNGNSDWDWFYGMNILGDPTLKPKGQTIITKTRNPGSAENYPVDWEPAETISSDSESDGFPKITAALDNEVWVIWESGRSTINGRAEIYSAVRDETSWSAAMNVGPFSYWDYNPDIAIDSLQRPVAVWAGWQDIDGNYQYDIFYSIYDGSWSARQLLAPLDPAFDMKPTLARNREGHLRVAWESRRDLNLNIYTAYFNGSSWSLPEQVTVHEADEISPKLVIDSLDQAWVFYTWRFCDHSEIWGSYYTGSEWVESGPISGNQEKTFHPTCAVDENGNIWVAWQSSDNGNVDIYASYFNGAVWSSPTQITTSIQSDLFPDMTTDNSGTAWLVYQSKSGGEWDIYATHCSDLVWSAPELVAGPSGADINPQITCSNENELWVCWQSYSTGNWEIMATHRLGFGIAEHKVTPTDTRAIVLPTVFSQCLNIITPRENQIIHIYDSRGSLIQTLFSREQKSATWFPQNIPSGTYFVVVENVNNYITKKVVYLK